MIVLLGLLYTAGCAQIDVTLTAYRAQDQPMPAAAGVTVGVAAETEPPEPLLEREIERKLSLLMRERGFTLAPLDEADYVLSAFAAIDAGRPVVRSYEAYAPPQVVTRSVYTHYGRRAYVRTYYPMHSYARSYTVTVFTHALELNFVDNQRFLKAEPATRDEAILWRASATTRADSSDLRRMVDPLLVAALAQFGQDTGRQIEVHVKTGDERLEALRR